MMKDENPICWGPEELTLLLRTCGGPEAEEPFYVKFDRGPSLGGLTSKVRILFGKRRTSTTR